MGDDTTNFIPLVDLDPWFEGDDAARRELSATVDKHLRRCGFLVVINHRIDPAVFANTRAACSEFFHLDQSAKQEIAQPANGAYRGWVAGGKESNAATYGLSLIHI